jgi:hypothetical protein
MPENDLYQEARDAVLKSIAAVASTSLSPEDLHHLADALAVLEPVELEFEDEDVAAEDRSSFGGE